MDTDVLIEVLDRKSKKGDEALDKIKGSGEAIGTTPINVHEILYGLHKYGRPVKEILQLPVLNFGREESSLSARIELDAEKRGTPVRRTDTMIAAVVMANAASLYTFDLRHFSPLRALGLKLFNS